MSGEVSISTRVILPLSIRSTSIEQRERRFLGLSGSQAPQCPPIRGTPPDDPQPRMVKRSRAMLTPPSAPRRRG